MHKQPLLNKPHPKIRHFSADKFIGQKIKTLCVTKGGKEKQSLQKKREEVLHNC